MTVLSAMFLLAQAVPDDGALEWLKTLAPAAGGTAFAIWWGWYTATKTLPKMQEDHRSERAATQSEYRAERATMTTAFKEAMNEVVAHCAEENKEQRLGFIAELERSNHQNKNLIDAYRWRQEMIAKTGLDVGDKKA